VSDIDLAALRTKLAFAKRFAHEGWPDGYVGVTPDQAETIIAALEDRERLREAVLEWERCRQERETLMVPLAPRAEAYAEMARMTDEAHKANEMLRAALEEKSK
jgi:hypothetical protein